MLYAHASRGAPQRKPNPHNAAALIQTTWDPGMCGLTPHQYPWPPRSLTGSSSFPTAGYHTRNTAVKKYPRFDHDSALDQYHERLFWWVYFLLHHRTRRSHYSESLGGLDHSRSRKKFAIPAPRSRALFLTLGAPTANMWRLACKKHRNRSEVPEAFLRVPGHLQKP